MLDASSHGRVAPKTKTINVEANLLAERLAERERLRAAVGKKMLVVLAVAGFFGLVLPAVWRLNLRANQSAAKYEKAEAAISGSAAAIEKQQDAAKPLIEDRTAREKIQRNGREYLGQLTSFFNDASTGMVFSTVRAEVTAGEMKIDARADCKDYSIAKQFVTDTGKGERVRHAVLVNVSHGSLFGENSVAFEIVKSVGVQP